MILGNQGASVSYEMRLQNPILPVGVVIYIMQSRLKKPGFKIKYEFGAGDMKVR